LYVVLRPIVKFKQSCAPYFFEAGIKTFNTRSTHRHHHLYEQRETFTLNPVTMEYLPLAPPVAPVVAEDNKPSSSVEQEAADDFEEFKCCSRITPEKNGDLSSSTPAEQEAAPGIADTTTGKKRPADPDDLRPSITKAQALERVNATFPGAKKAKTAYAYYKDVVIASYKEKKEKPPTAKDIQETWKSIKHIRFPAHQEKENISNQHECFKFESERIADAEGKTRKEQLLRFCTSLDEGATALLQWSSLHVTLETLQDLEHDIATVNVALTKVELSWPTDLPKTYPDALKKAQAELSNLKQLENERKLVIELRKGDPQFLAKHVKQFYSHKIKAEAWEKQTKAKKEKEAAAEIEAESISIQLKPLVYKAIEKKMKYDAQMKTSNIQVRHELTNVSELAFRKAFGKDGKAVISGDEVQRKTLRFGAEVVCGNITCEHFGTILIATAYIRMEKEFRPFSRW
jgi:hypothetical protein